MFTDERARQSIINARRALKSFFRDISLDEVKINRHEARDLQRDLKEIIRNYWANHDYDQRVTYADMKEDTNRLLVRSQRMQHAIKILPKTTLISLNRLISHRIGNWSTPINHITPLLDGLALLEAVCEPIAKANNLKSAGNSIEIACSELYDVWKLVTKRDFDRIWDIVLTSERMTQVYGPQMLLAPDARFIQVVLQAANPELTAGTILDRLKRAARTKPKSKPRKRSSRTKPKSR